MKTSYSLILTSLILFFFLPLFCIAQEEKESGLDVYNLSLDQLGKMVVTASKTPQSVTKITQKVDVITEKQINTIVQENRNIAELIQYVPGASVKVLSRNDANWGAYGGIGPKYCTYMLYGLPIDGFADPMSIENNAIQRIEIQRGPASILYANYLSQDFAGNQSPLAGTVNLILRENIVGPRSIYSINYGSYNTMACHVYHEQKVGRAETFGGISFEESDYTNYGSTDSWLNMQKNPDYKKAKAIIGGAFSIGQEEKHKVQFFGNFTTHSGDVGRINRKYDNHYGLLNIGYSGQLSPMLKIGFKAGLRSYDRSWQEDNFGATGSEALREIDEVKQTIVPIDLSVSYSHLKNSRLIIGVDHQQANYVTTARPVDGFESVGNDANASQTGLYCQEEVESKKFTFRGGARYNFIGYDIEKYNGQAPDIDKQTWQVFLWSAGTRFRFNNDWSVYANAGNSFLTPALKAIGGTLKPEDKNVPGKNGQLPNLDLKSENGMGFDLGFDGAVGSIDLSFRGFTSIVNNAIIENVVSQNPSQTMAINAEGKTTVKGFEFSIKQVVNQSFDWFANFTYSDSEIKNPYNPDQDGVEIPFVPRMMGNLGLTLQLPFDIELSPIAHFGGIIYDNNSKSSRTAFESGELINLHVSKDLKIAGNNTIQFFLKLYNLTNNQFDMPWQFRDPGFSYTLGVKMIL